MCKGFLSRSHPLTWGHSIFLPSNMFWMAPLSPHPHPSQPLAISVRWSDQLCLLPPPLLTHVRLLPLTPFSNTRLELPCVRVACWCPGPFPSRRGRCCPPASFSLSSHTSSASHSPTARGLPIRPWHVAGHGSWLLDQLLPDSQKGQGLALASLQP